MSAHRPWTLEKILEGIAVETNDTIDPSHSIDARRKHILAINAAQVSLWDDWEWKGFDVVHDFPINAHQTVYNIPESVDISRVRYVGFRPEGEDHWLHVRKGFNLFANNIRDAESRPAPGYEYDELGTPQRWRPINNQGAQALELWPRPDAPGVLRFDGTLALKELVEGDDMSLLDGRLIALTAAARLQAAMASEDSRALSVTLRREATTRAMQLRRAESGNAGEEPVRIGLEGYSAGQRIGNVPWRRAWH